MESPNRPNRLTGKLPVHTVPAAAGGHGSLVIDGLVSHPTVLDQSEFAALAHGVVAVDFSCEEGWTVPQLRWRGVTLSTLAELVQPLASARWVRVCAGAYEVTLDVAMQPDALLCDELNGDLLTTDHGAPWRLLVPGDRCVTSVKWVDRLEFTSQPGEPVAERIARARLQQP